MSRKQARQQVGNPISYIFGNESNIKSNQLVEEFQTFKDIMDDTGMSAKEVADILGPKLVLTSRQAKMENYPQKDLKLLLVTYLLVQKLDK